MAVICVNKGLPLYPILIGNKLDTGNCHQNADLQTGKQVSQGLSQCRTMDLLYPVPPSGPRATGGVSKSLFQFNTEKISHTGQTIQGNKCDANTHTSLFRGDVSTGSYFCTNIYFINHLVCMEMMILKIGEWTVVSEIL